MNTTGWFLPFAIWNIRTAWVRSPELACHLAALIYNRSLHPSVSCKTFLIAVIRYIYILYIYILRVYISGPRLNATYMTHATYRDLASLVQTVPSELLTAKFSMPLAWLSHVPVPKPKKDRLQ